MTICRVQQSPWENKRLYKTIESTLHFRFSSSQKSTSREYHFMSDILPVILDYIDKPLILSFISMALRTVPMLDEDSAYLEVQSGIDKEFECSQGQNRPQLLDYTCLFGDPSLAHEPLHAYAPISADVILPLRSALAAWKVLSLCY